MTKYLLPQTILEKKERKSDGSSWLLLYTLNHLEGKKKQLRVFTSQHKIQVNQQKSPMSAPKATIAAIHSFLTASRLKCEIIMRTKFKVYGCSFTSTFEIDVKFFFWPTLT